MDAPTVVFDTNVLVAELAFPDEPERCVSLAESDAVEVAISPTTLREFAAVLSYDHLPLATHTPERRARTVERVADFARVVEHVARVDAAFDPDDDAILECALAAAADCVVSDDAHLLELGEFDESSGCEGPSGRSGPEGFVGIEVLSREAFLARRSRDRIGGRAHRNPEG